MTLAPLIGIDMPEIDLINLDTIKNPLEGLGDVSGKAYAIARFNRTPAGPGHIEDFAQVYGIYPENKYKSASTSNIATVLGTEGMDDDVAEFICRLAFNTLIGNAGMHMKTGR